MKKKNGPDITLRWMGTAAFEICAAGKTLLIDPFVSRPPLWRVFTGRPLERDENETARSFPRADIILISHSHYDHLMDAPSIAVRTGAVIAGSPTTCFIAESMGVARNRLLVLDDPPVPFRRGPFEIALVPGLHGRVLLGRVPFRGSLSATPKAPPRKAAEYPLGNVYGIYVKARGISIFHNGSADLIDENLRGIKAHVLLLGLASRSYTKDYIRRMIQAVEPEVVVPCHYDWFFSPLRRGVRHLPGIGMGKFLKEVHDVDPEIRVLCPGLGATVGLMKAGKGCAFV